MTSVAGLMVLIWRMKAMVALMSATGSGGLPSTNENSGTMPYSRMRLASSRVRLAVTLPPLFMRLSTSSEPDSAPLNTIFRPLAFILRQVASL